MVLGNRFEDIHRVGIGKASPHQNIPLNSKIWWTLIVIVISLIIRVRNHDIFEGSSGLRFFPLEKLIWEDIFAELQVVS
jgi:hypothetical protein